MIFCGSATGARRRRVGERHTLVRVLGARVQLAQAVGVERSSRPRTVVGGRVERGDRDELLAEQHRRDGALVGVDAREAHVRSGR